MDLQPELTDGSDHSADTQEAPNIGLYSRSGFEAAGRPDEQESPTVVKKTPGFADDFDPDLDEDLESEEPYADDKTPLDDLDEADEESEDELSGLEAEELNMVDHGFSEQAMEVAGFRRQELSINPDEHAIRQNEFQCRACFLIKRINQRSSLGSRTCVDCY